MRRFITVLVVVLAVLAATTGAALAADPVQSATQSSSTGQAALAGSSATQLDPSNQAVSVRVLSPGSDGAVTQSNTAGSTATATNTAPTSQTALQTALASCGCSLPGGVQSTQQDTSTSQLAGASSSATQTDPSNTAISVRVLSPGSGGAVWQSNTAGSTADAANTAPTSQTASQAGGGSGVQSSTQSADTEQAALAGSSASQVDPSNSAISVRVLSPGGDGAVTQSNDAHSSATATNTAPTTQSATQTAASSPCGCSNPSAVQSSTQDSGVGEAAGAASSAAQQDPSNASDPARIGSSGGNGSASQSNDAASAAHAGNTATPTQTTTQQGGGVEAAGQQSDVGQLAGAFSSATQTAPSNTADPVRIGSDGSDGSVWQGNAVHSGADASNTASPSQTASQQGSGGCGCSGLGIQALGQSSDVEQLAVALSSADQVGASNAVDPVRIGSAGSGGSVHQSNDAGSWAGAHNDAPVAQSGTQGLSGPGVQALGQESTVGQAALAASAASQTPAASRCGCGPAFGNTADPVRIGSDGSDGSVWQGNAVHSGADASNTASPSQTASQQGSGGCGCSGLGIQALGQSSDVEQLAVALSSADQVGASNAVDPVRIGSAGSGGSVHQSNDAGSRGRGENIARVVQRGSQLML